jgi:hypothetical protein
MILMSAFRPHPSLYFLQLNSHNMFCITSVSHGSHRSDVICSFFHTAHTALSQLCVIALNILEVCCEFTVSLGLWQFPEASRRGGDPQCFSKRIMCSLPTSLDSVLMIDLTCAYILVALWWLLAHMKEEGREKEDTEPIYWWQEVK